MPISQGEQKLLNYLNSLYEEGAKARERWSANWNRNLEVLKGNVWPKQRPKYKVDAVMNFISQIVEKKAALLTDSKPTFDIVSRHKGLDDVCYILKKINEAIDEERNWEVKLTEFVILEQLFGIAFFHTCFDQALDWGKGDIDVVVIDPRTVVFDPFVLRTYNLNSAEYFCLETIRPTEYLKELYKHRADDIKADFSSAPVKEDSVLSKIRQLFSSHHQPTAPTSVIPRSIVRDYWVRDRTTRNEDGTLAYPNWREILVAGGVIVADGTNPYIDGNLPFDGMEWDFNVDSAYGRSEIEKLEMPQILFNKVLAVIIENAILMGNGIWIGDTNALTEEGWRKLSNEPGSHVRKRPGSELRREGGVPLPNYITNVLTMLLGGLEKLSSITEVIEGRRPGQVCVDPETECLTKRGWKKFWELQDDDLLYSFDPETETGIWSPLLDLKVYDYEGPMYCIQTDRLDALVTPNHGWLVGTTNNTSDKEVHHRNRRSTDSGWGIHKYQRIETKDLNSTHYIPACAPLNPSVTKKIFSDNFVELVGWIVTEGCFSITQRENGKLRHRCIISQSLKTNKENCYRIAKCLRRCGLVTDSTMWGRVDPHGVVSWTIEGDIAKSLMESFPQKRLTYEFISSLTSDQVRLLYKTMLLGDGSLAEGDKYFSADPILADQFQMVATLAGYPTRLSIQQGKGSRTGNHKRPWYSSNITTVSCRSENRIQWRNLLPKMKKINYRGKVWCPTVTTSVWLARRNGITYLTGNTSGAAIESLQIAASTAIRLKARQLEALQSRIGQKRISRIFQYYTEDRVFNLLGDDGKFHKYVWERDKVRRILEENNISITQAFQEFRYKIIPASSLAITKWQKGLVAMQLYQAGIIDGEEVLKILEWPNWEEVYARMKEKQVMGIEGVPKRPQKLPKSVLRGGHMETGLQFPQTK